VKRGASEEPAEREVTREKYCACCARRDAAGVCDVLKKEPSEGELGLCEDAGWRDVRQQSRPAARHSASTGDWAIALEKV
jgi:hypothetical protein